jgi:hypothetical protein
VLLERAQRLQRRHLVDIVLVIVTIAFFALSWAYTAACDRI